MGSLELCREIIFQQFRGRMHHRIQNETIQRLGNFKDHPDPEEDRDIVRGQELKSECESEDTGKTPEKVQDDQRPATYPDLCIRLCHAPDATPCLLGMDEEAIGSPADQEPSG